MSFMKFFAGKVFIINLFLAVVVLVLLLWFTLRMLAVYTNHGESFAAPDFYGLDQGNVKLLADKYKLRYLINDSVYYKGCIPGTVTEQSPEAGHYIKKGRKIYLTVASYHPEYIILPRLTDISLMQARIQIESSGLVVGNIDFRLSRFNDLVLEQGTSGIEAEVGEMVPKGTVIDLIVGRTSGSKIVVVPDLTGLDANSAALEIRKSNLSLGTVIFGPGVKDAVDSLNAKVWRQEPQPGKPVGVLAGGEIDLWLRGEEEIDNEDN